MLFRSGVGPEHWIEPGTELEYLVRFQNTGTDTAFTVVVVDTLATWLDPESVCAGASSHAYIFQMSGPGILTFTFPQILLPDSLTDVAGSQGFVKFFVKVRPDVPQGTLLLNNAAIYFDFNVPVITNTTTHTVGKNFLLSRTKDVPEAAAAFTVFPNPATDQAVVQLRHFSARQGRVEMLDAQGRVVGRQVFSGSQVLLQAGALPSGLYLIRVFDGTRFLGSEKLAWMRQ